MPTDLRNIQTADVANRTIVPYRVGGTLRVGKQDVPLNRAYQRFGRPKVMQQFANRYMNDGGTSKLFGKNPRQDFGEGTDPLPTVPPTGPDTMATIWAASTTLRLPMMATGTYDFFVDWGDDTPIQHVTEYGQGVHFYGFLPGPKVVLITGKFEGWSWAFQGNGYQQFFLRLVQFGNEFQFLPREEGDNFGFFNQCSRMTELRPTDVPGLVGVTNLANMFSGSRLLTSIDLTGWDVSNVENFQSTFSIALLDTIDGVFNGGWDFSNATNVSSLLKGSNYDIGEAGILALNFPLCENFQSIFSGTNLSGDIDLSTWTGIPIADNLSNMFENNVLMTSLIVFPLPATATIVSYMFQGCHGLTTLDLSSWATQVSTIEFMYSFPAYNMDNLTSMDLTGWDLGNITGANNWFAILENWSAPVDFNNIGWDGVNHNGVLTGNPLMTSIAIDQWDMSAVSTMYNWLQDTPIDVASYDAILDINTGWPSRPFVPDQIWSPNLAQYTPGGNAQLGREALQAGGWSINDGGPVGGSPPPLISAFTSIFQANIGPTEIRLSGVSNQENYAIGSSANVKSDDLSYDATGVVTSYDGGGLNLAIPYTVDAGDGIITEVLP